MKPRRDCRSDRPQKAPIRVPGRILRGYELARLPGTLEYGHQREPSLDPLLTEDRARAERSGSDGAAGGAVVGGLEGFLVVFDAAVPEDDRHVLCDWQTCFEQAGETTPVGRNRRRRWRLTAERRRFGGLGAAVLPFHAISNDEPDTVLARLLQQAASQSYG